MPSLSSVDFRKALDKGSIDPVYYFHGNEDLLKHDALQALIDRVLEPSTRDFNYERRRAADVTAEAFETLALTPPMLAERRVVVITEVEDLQQRRSRAQATRTSLLAYLGRPFPETLLVLVQSAGEEVDHEIAGRCTGVDFGSLTPDQLRKWLAQRAGREQLELEPAAAAHLHEAVGDDLGQLAAEISKLASAVRGRPATAEDVASLVGVRHGETVHDFVDAVTARDFASALGMLSRILETPGVTGVRIVMNLGTVLTGLALVRAHLDRGASASAAKQVAWESMKANRPFGLRVYGQEADRWVRDAARWTSAGLDAALAELLAADRRLKNTTIDDDVKILRGALLAMAERGARAA